MSCDPEALKHVPLFALLDDEETAVLAGQVELKKFAPRQRIYKMGDSTGQAYVMVSGRVRFTTLDQDPQEVVIDEPAHGEFFGFASMLEQTPHQTTAIALEESECFEVDRHDIAVLLQRKPMAGMDMLTVLGKQFHTSQQLVRVRASRNPNEMIEKEATFGERIADSCYLEMIMSRLSWGKVGDGEGRPEVSQCRPFCSRLYVLHWSAKERGFRPGGFLAAGSAPKQKSRAD